MKLIKTGATRMVLIIGKYAVKLPYLSKGWDMFLIGLSCNNTESIIWRKYRSEALCPVLINIMGIIVMPTLKQTGEINLNHPFTNPDDDEYRNYGVYRGNVVKLDYGWVDRKLVICE